MQQAGAEDNKDGGIERGWNLNGTEQGEKAHAHGYADVAVPYLGTEDNIRAPGPPIVEGDKGVREDHQEPAEPSQVLE